MLAVDRPISKFMQSENICIYATQPHRFSY